MDSLEQTMVEWLTQVANQVPMEVFVTLGAFLEEIIAPIPSPFIISTVALYGVAQQKSWVWFVLVTLLGSASKTFASYLIYFVSKKSEGWIGKKLTKVSGLSQKRIESFGARISSGFGGLVLLTFMRGFPLLPSLPITVLCGLIQIRTLPFILSTFIGTIFRYAVIMIPITIGLEWLKALNTPFWVYGVLFVLAVIAYLVYKKITSRLEKPEPVSEPESDR